MQEFGLALRDPQLRIRHVADGGKPEAPNRSGPAVKPWTIGALPRKPIVAPYVLEEMAASQAELLAANSAGRNLSGTASSQKTTDPKDGKQAYG